mmetsp:Transcript_5137/g.13347  ORF Transcript_5137/g.13347 Transcript_5137/m.13347 type:complete len:258 (-) Transcript_5137:1107-1880(-)
MPSYTCRFREPRPGHCGPGFASGCPVEANQRGQEDLPDCLIRLELVEEGCQTDCRCRRGLVAAVHQRGLRQRFMQRAPQVVRYELGTKVCHYAAEESHELAVLKNATSSRARDVRLSAVGQFDLSEVVHHEYMLGNLKQLQLLGRRRDAGTRTNACSKSRHDSRVHGNGRRSRLAKVHFECRYQNGTAKLFVFISSTRLTDRLDGSNKFIGTNSPRRKTREKYRNHDTPRLLVDGCCDKCINSLRRIGAVGGGSLAV